MKDILFILFNTQLSTDLCHLKSNWKDTLWLQHIKIWKNGRGMNTFLLFFDLQVNDIDLRQAIHDEAIVVLRLTTQRVRLCVFRHQEAYREEDLWDVFTLELTPCPDECLGFTTVGKR